MEAKGDLSALAGGGGGGVDAGMPSLKSLMQLKKKYDAPDIGGLPEGYKKNSDKERLYLWSADNFKRQIRFNYPLLKPLCLTSKNECGIEKLSMTFIKPTILPYSHLFGLEECAKFISDFLFYEPKQYKDTLWSPTYVLATQIGNSLELSTVLVSFLIGFGFNAYVVCGWVDKATSAMDRKLEKCPMLAKAEIQAEADTSHLSTKYTPKKPPELRSKYMQFLKGLKQEANGRKYSNVAKMGADIKSTVDEIIKDQTEDQEPPEEHFFHAWVYVDIEESCGFFIEAPTGQRKTLDDPAYKSINSAWNHENYWLNKQEDEDWKNAKSLDLADESKWIKFVCDMELPKKTEDGQGDSPKRLLNNLYCWLNDLVVPKDCFELMYRLGQKSSEFKNVNVEYFAPYLLKDGMVQRVTQYRSPDDDKSTISDLDYDTHDEYDAEELEQMDDLNFGIEDEEEATDEYEEDEEDELDEVEEFVPDPVESSVGSA